MYSLGRTAVVRDVAVREQRAEDERELVDAHTALWEGEPAGYSEISLLTARTAARGATEGTFPCTTYRDSIGRRDAA